MQWTGAILRNGKTDFSRSFDCVKIVLPIILTLAILISMTLNILPALASEAREPDHAGTTAMVGSHAAVVARARIVNPFRMSLDAQNSGSSKGYGMTVSRRTTHRDCSALLGADSDRDVGASCELRLIELE